MATPLIRALKTRLPRVTLHICVEPAYECAIRGNPHIDSVIYAKKAGWPPLSWRVRRARYDAVIDALGSPRTARLAFYSRAPRRIGFARYGRRLFYTETILPRVGRYSALGKLALAEPLGLHDVDCRIEIATSAEDLIAAERFFERHATTSGGPLVAFSPVSRRKEKIWPAGRFAFVCDHLHETHGLRFLPLFGPGEQGMIEAVASQMKHKDALIHPCDVVSFGALKPVIERCAFFFGNDNGIRHVAIATGRPTAAVFAHPDPRCWTPPDDERHFTVGGRRRIDRIAVDEVNAMLERLLERFSAIL